MGLNPSFTVAAKTDTALSEGSANPKMPNKGRNQLT
jgi:hypothetical protein